MELRPLRARPRLFSSAGARKLGAAGDFVTAPEMSAFFGRALAQQVAEVMEVSMPLVLEVGAGSGRLAVDVLRELEGLGKLPERYEILDLSADLRERQQATLAAAVPHLLPRVHWLDRLPEHFSGVVLANELLDAMPAHVVAWRESGIFDRGVAPDAQGGFTRNERPATGALLAAAEEIAAQCSLPPWLRKRNQFGGPRLGRGMGPPAAARHPAPDRLRLSAARVLTSATRTRHPDVPLPSPRAS